MKKLEEKKKKWAWRRVFSNCKNVIPGLEPFSFLSSVFFSLILQVWIDCARLIYNLIFLFFSIIKKKTNNTKHCSLVPMRLKQSQRRQHWGTVPTCHHPINGLCPYRLGLDAPTKEESPSSTYPGEVINENSSMERRSCGKFSLRTQNGTHPLFRPVLFNSTFWEDGNVLQLHSLVLTTCGYPAPKCV